MLKEANVTYLKVVPRQTPTDNGEYNNMYSKYVASSQDLEKGVHE